MKKLLLPLFSVGCSLFILNFSDAKPKSNSEYSKARETAKKDCLQEIPELKGKSLQKCIKRKIRNK